MNRGYIKFWRKAQDSSSWSRGLMYQGLIINLLSRAAWKKSSYQGRDILPGQFGAVMSHLADSLSVPKTTLHRMVSHLSEDGFLKVENVGNRFTVITITNWHLYQEQDKASWNADGTPVEHQRNADGTPLYREDARDNEIKELKKREEGGECAHARVATTVPGKGTDAHQPDSPTPKKLDCPSKGNPQWPAFLSCWQVYPVKQGQEEAWREWMRLHEAGTLDQAWEIRDAILSLVGEDSRWQRGKVPKMAKWLNGKGWNDEPYIEPSASTAVAVRDGPPTARTQYQKGRQDMEGIAKFVLAADREFEKHGNDTANHNGIGPHGNALPAANEPGGTPGLGNGVGGIVRQPQR